MSHASTPVAFPHQFKLHALSLDHSCGLLITPSLCSQSLHALSHLTSYCRNDILNSELTLVFPSALSQKTSGSMELLLSLTFQILENMGHVYIYSFVFPSFP